MLNASDLRNYFKNLPRDFKLIINGKEYRCNKQCLTTHSEFFKGCTSNEVSIEFPITDEGASKLVGYLHGEELGTVKDIDFISFSSIFGIETFKNRAAELLDTIKPEDFQKELGPVLQRTLDIESFVTYFSKNAELVKTLVQADLIPSTIIHRILTSNIMQNEDDNLFLIQKYNSCHSPPDYTLYSDLNTENLSDESLSSFLSSPNEALQNAKVFPLIRKLLKQNSKLKSDISTENAKLNGIREQIRTCQEELRVLMERIGESSFDRLDSIRCKCLEYVDALEMLASDISLIALVTSDAQKFLTTMESMNKICKAMDEQIEASKKGFLSWFKTSVDSEINELIRTIKDFENETVEKLQPDQEKIFKVSNDIMEKSKKLKNIITGQNN
ncbi:hypothetical protein GPJ56_005680 [Histomonas meleagridis]|uniref:uncharacterized protein n=1 Tax=Histomonas meleagridis TaxID=135588 RepID=UPI00355A9E34|nr:hypothetical protein GPJ56_005680 [Histomonas meleagridis]KAH0803385.1 hypothetical protein GO595_003729 [Histomonas meleagridis]